MADHDNARAHPCQLRLQPFDARQIEMIGRLIEQQDIRRGCQHTGQRGPTRLTARQGSRLFGSSQSKLLEQVPCAVAIFVSLGVQSGFNIGLRRLEPRKVWLLRQIADRRTRLREAASRIRLHEAGGDAQHGRLAGAVASDQADPIVRSDRQSGAGQQRRSAKGKDDVLQQKKRWWHKSDCYCEAEQRQELLFLQKRSKKLLSFLHRC